jgi:predicted Zn-dependent protease
MRRAPPPLPIFGVDELVAGRYRIARFLGQGAVGEVYAVRDLELGAEVALKVLKSGSSVGGPAIERFKREILLARRVSHPNVCRIFDLGVHLLERPGGEREPVLFLTMELLDGRTLVRRIEEEGPLSEPEAAVILRQLAEGLAAAHRAGVVHRDLKSSNVLLVPGDPAPRAVITDFGLAREQDLPSGAAALTATGGVLGTPAYMAPEQVEGRRATPRSDLYALGIVLYEMVTGALPFEGESPLSVAVRRLHEEPIPIESRRADLSPRFRAVVRRCLERAPEDRFESALDVARALEGRARALAPRRLRRRVAAALAAVLAVAAGWGVWRAVEANRAPAVAAAARPERLSVAVLGLRNATGRPESAWLQPALAEMLTSELAAGDTLRAVPGETVARAVADLALAPADALAGPTLARLRRTLGADWVLLGAYTALGPGGDGRMRLDLRLQRTDGGRDQPLSEQGSEEELFDLVARAGRGLRRALGAGEAPSATEAPARAAMPGSAEAVRLYSQGLAKLRAYEPLAARELLEQAVAADPAAPLAWSALARAWSDLGYSNRAREAARTAWEKSGRLMRSDALLVEARFRLASADWDAAVEDFRALWRFFPDDLEHGLNLVSALLDAARAAEALAALDELRALREPAASDPRIDLFEARAAEGLSDFRRQAAAAGRAGDKAEAAGSKSLLARARYEQGVAARKLGDVAASRSALLEARRLAAEVGDRAGVALSLQALANLERAQGALDEGAALFAEARSIFQALGNRQGEARAELSQGLVVSEQGDLAGAERLYASALEKLREVGDRRGAASALSNLGTMRFEQGDLAGALARHTEALAEFRALGDESRQVVALQNLAPIRLERGEIESARAAAQEGLAIAHRIGDRAGEGYALKTLGDVEAERGDVAAAARRFDEAAAVFRAAGQEPWVRLTELAAALLERGQGRGASAEVELARLAAEFARAGANSDHDEAALQRLRLLIELGRGAEAGGVEAGALLARAEASDSRRLRHLARLARGELALARGETAAARRAFEANRAEAERSGLVLQALEARAGLARALAAAGDPGAGRMASEVASEARRLGCGRLLAMLATERGVTPGV